MHDFTSSALSDYQEGEEGGVGDGADWLGERERRRMIGRG